MTAIVDIGLARFGKRTDESAMELAAEACVPLLRRAQERQPIDRIVVANAYAGELNGISGMTFSTT